MTASLDQPFDLRTALARSGAAAFLRVAPRRWICGAGPFTRARNPPERGVAFYVNDFSLGAPEPWLIPASSWDDSPVVVADGKLTIDWKNLPRAGFESAYEEAMAEIHAGRLRKAVLALAERGRLVEGDLATLMSRALQPREALSCWGYGYCENDDGFAGATPECLFSLRGTRLQTMALAGTAKPAEQAGFEADTKEIREHQLVVESVATKLKALGDVRCGPREILNVGDMLHFITRFEVEIDRPDPEPLLRLLHPTPAIGVVPATPQSIERLLEWRRQLAAPPHFGAPFGVRWDGGLHMVVAIRCVSWTGDDVFLPSGCGIVEASQLEREWRELALKRAWVKHALDLE
jgi:menaquinone-specific isochorismate synthase